MALLGKIFGAFRNAAKTLFSFRSSYKAELPTGRNIQESDTPKVELPRAHIDSSPIAQFSSIKIVKEEGATKIDADGHVYSLFEFAKKFGICFSTLYGRIQKGWDIKDAINVPRKVNRDYKKTSPVKAKLWEWNGEKHTVEEWARIYGVQKAMMRKRLNANGSPERNTERLEAYKANRARRYIWDGESHSIKEWAEIYKVPESTMRGRWAKHKSPEHLDNPVIPPVGKEWEYNGESHTVAEWARILGKGQSTIRKNFHKYGAPILIKTTKEKQSTQESDDDLYPCDGEWKTLKQWSKEFRIPQNEIKRNFELYGTPEKPALDIVGEKKEGDESEREIDEILKEVESEKKNEKQEGIHDWLKKIENEPDDGTPLRDILGLSDEDFQIVRGALVGAI